MSDTPRTDAALNWPMSTMPDANSRVLKIAQVSRELERDLTAARARIAELEQPGMVSVPQEVYEALLAWTGAEPSQSVLARAVDNWLAAAKGGKS